MIRVWDAQHLPFCTLESWEQFAEMVKDTLSEKEVWAVRYIHIGQILMVYSLESGRSLPVVEYYATDNPDIVPEKV